MRETCVCWMLVAFGCLAGCRATVVELPADQALAATTLLEQRGIASRARSRGVRKVLDVAERDAPAARALLTAAGFPRSASAPPARVLLSPTEARLRDRRRRLDALREALRALPGVLDARLVRHDGRLAVTLVVLPDAPTTAATARRLVGPDAHIERSVFTPPPRSEPSARRAAALTAVIGVLMVTIVGLLMRIRRLRRALGQ